MGMLLAVNWPVFKASISILLLKSKFNNLGKAKDARDGPCSADDSHLGNYVWAQHGVDRAPSSRGIGTKIWGSDRALPPQSAVPAVAAPRCRGGYLELIHGSSVSHYLVESWTWNTPLLSLLLFSRPLIQTANSPKLSCPTRTSLPPIDLLDVKPHQYASKPSLSDLDPQDTHSIRMNGLNGGNGPAMVTGYPTPAGYQAELAYIYNMVEMLSQQLAENKRALEDVVTSVGRVRSRARTQALGNEELLTSAADELTSKFTIPSEITFLSIL